MQVSASAIPHRLQGRIGYTLILYFVILAILPISILSIVVIRESNSKAQDQSINQLTLVQEIRSRDIQSWLDTSYNILLLTRQDVRQSVLIYELLGDENPRTSTPLIINAYLQEKVEAQTLFEDFFLYTISGEMRASTIDSQISLDALSLNIADQPYFEGSLANDNYAQSPTYDAETGQFRMVATQLVITPTGEVMGVIAGHLNMARLNEIMTARGGLGDSGEAYLISPADNRLVTPNRAFTVAGNHSFSSTGIDAALQQQPGAGVYQNYRGEDVIGAYTWLPDLQLALLTELSVDEALGAGREIQRLAQYVTLGLGGFAVLIGLIVALWITTPIRLLTETATQIAAGDYSRRAPVTRQNEIGQLAQAFNAMTDQVSGLIDNLEERVSERTRDLKLAAEVSKQITIILDINDLLQKVVSLTTEGFGFYATFVFIADEPGKILHCDAGSILTADGITPFRFRSLALNTEPSIIAKAGRERVTVAVQDTYQSPLYLRSDALPNTRSEVAIPMLLGDRLVGVFDVQSEQVNRFTPEVLNILQTLADQIAIAIRNAQLFTEAQAAQLRAEKANQVKSQFLASVSHELRTPLNSIINYSQFVSRGVMGPVTERQGEALTKVIGSGKHLLRLINDVLDISRIESGSLELFVEDNVDLRPELEMVLATCESLVAEKSVKLALEIAGELPLVSVDRQRITQVMLNLMSNACKFTETGTITLSASQQADQIVLAVRDTGPGIAPADHEAVFEPFVQTEAGIKHGGGTGLGLPISKRLIEAHGGTIRLESIMGTGTTFFVTFPSRVREVIVSTTPPQQAARHENAHVDQP